MSHEYRDGRDALNLVEVLLQWPSEYGWARDGDAESHVFWAAMYLVHDTDKRWLNWGAGDDVQHDEWEGILDALCAEFRRGLIAGMRWAHYDVPEDLA